VELLDLRVTVLIEVLPKTREPAVVPGVPKAKSPVRERVKTVTPEAEAAMIFWSPDSLSWTRAGQPMHHLLTVNLIRRYCYW